MYYSLTFGGSKNTWTDWKLIPESPPMVDPPTPNTNLVDIPGRTKGPIDLSKAVYGKITYQRITGSWTFVRDVENRMTRMGMYETIRRWLHGRETTVSLEEDPAHYFKGRFTVSAPTSNQYPIRIAIGFDLEPVRYNVSDDSIDSTWLSDWSD